MLKLPAVITILSGIRYLKVGVGVSMLFIEDKSLYFVINLVLVSFPVGN